MPEDDDDPIPPVVGRRRTNPDAPRFFFLEAVPSAGLTVSAMAVGGGGLAGGSGGVGVFTDMHMVVFFRWL